MVSNLKNSLKFVSKMMILLVSVLMLGTVAPSQAYASSNDFKSFNQEAYTDANGRSWVRLEFELEKDKLNYTVSENPDKPKQLTITLKDAGQGKLRSDYTLDGKITRYMTLRNGETKADKKDLYLMISVAKSLAEQEYHVYTIPKDKKLKCSFRLVIEIAADSLEEKKDESLGIVNGVSGRTIVVDPGHGGSDSGARGYENLLEKDVTFAVSLKMQKILEASGAKVIMTRTTDVDVYGPYASASQELQARCNYVTPRTDLFVCIHANASSNPDGKGTETYYCNGSWLGKLLATNIQAELIKAVGLRDRGIKTANFYVLTHTSVPANLVELGFVTNADDASVLRDEDYQTKMAMAVCQGIGNYFVTLRDNSGMYK